MYDTGGSLAGEPRYGVWLREGKEGQDEEVPAPGASALNQPGIGGDVALVDKVDGTEGAGQACQGDENAVPHPRSEHADRVAPRRDVLDQKVILYTLDVLNYPLNPNCSINEQCSHSANIIRKKKFKNLF